MIINDDGERFMNFDMVFYLTLHLNTHKRDPNDIKNKSILKRFIASFINKLEENDQQLLDKVYDFMAYNPERRYRIEDIKKLYVTL